MVVLPKPKKRGKVQTKSTIPNGLDTMPSPVSDVSLQSDLSNKNRLPPSSSNHQVSTQNNNIRKENDEIIM